VIAIYAARRLVQSALVLLTTIGALFWLGYIVPGDPASVMLGPRATPAEKAQLRSDMDLDKPAPVRLAHFLSRISRGDLGRDMVTRRPVAALIADALPHTLALTALAMAWAIAIGIPAGCWCAVTRDSWGDRLAGIASTALIALPTAVIGIYALLWFAVGLRWFPAIGAGRPGDIGDQLRHLALPAFTISIAWIGYLTRLSRASMLEVLNEPHVRTYRAFGVPAARIVRRYVLPIAVTPVISILGVGIGGMLSNAILIEIIFVRPGIGRLIYDAVLTRNFPVLMGAVLVAATLYLLINLIADLINASLDPRVRAAL
jgi:peptide/nickel transport system permease protein